MDKTTPAKILLIEDTQTIIEMVRTLLSDAGYKVFIATHGEMGIEIATRVLPDLILLDILMPGIDGYETCRRLKAHDHLKEIPVCFMSAVVEPFDKVKAFELGAVDYITKPIETAELLARIKTHIAIHRLQQELQHLNQTLEAQVNQRTAELQREIAEKHKTEQILRESENNLLAIYENTSDLILSIDPTYRVITINSAGKTLFKRLMNITVEPGTPLPEILPAPFASDWERNIHRALAGEHFTTEWRVTDNHQTYYLEIALNPIRNEDTIAGVSVFGRDITQQKRIEHQLTQQEQAIRRIITETANLTGENYFKKMTCVLNDLIQADYTFVGITTGKNVIETIALCHQGQIQDNIQYQLEGTPCQEVVTQTTCVYSHDVTCLFPQDVLLQQKGIEAYVGTPVFSKKREPLGILVALFTSPIEETGFITSLFELFAAHIGSEIERTRVERALRASELRYRQMFETNQAVKLIIDPVDGRIVEANQAAQEFYGYDLPTLTSMTIMEINQLPEAEVKAELKRATTKSQLNLHSQHKLASGEIREVEVYSGPVEIDGRTLLYSIVHDITDRKQAEQALQEYQEHLEDMIIQRTAELQQANEEKSELMSIVAHDLKNPLTAIATSVEVIALLISPDENSKLGKLFQTIDRMVKRMSLIINKLEKNQIESARLVAQQKPFVLTTIIERLISNYQLTCNRKQIQIHHINDTPCEIIADEQICTQIFDNLISNAIKFSPPGRNITIWSTELPDHIRIRIKDEGQGLTEADKAKLFQKFQKLSAKPTAGEPSTGLGLSIVKKLVEELHGKVWAESEGKDKGATFIVELPKYPHPPQYPN